MLLAVMALVACEPQKEDPEVTISIEPVTATMKVGDITTLEVKGATANIEWVSSN